MFENLIHTKIESTLPQGYTIFIEYSHGDADMVGHVEWHEPTIGGLKEYLTEFVKISARIDVARSEGTSYRKIKSDLILVCRDIIYEGSGVPAAMRIQKIEYLEGDTKYMVTGWES